jgi:hypothetical protein
MGSKVALSTRTCCAMSLNRWADGVILRQCSPPRSPQQQVAYL